MKHDVQEPLKERIPNFAQLPHQVFEDPPTRGAGLARACGGKLGQLLFRMASTTRVQAEKPPGRHIADVMGLACCITALTPQTGPSADGCSRPLLGPSQGLQSKALQSNPGPPRSKPHGGRRVTVALSPVSSKCCAQQWQLRGFCDLYFSGWRGERRVLM